MGLLGLRRRESRYRRYSHLRQRVMRKRLQGVLDSLSAPRRDLDTRFAAASASWSEGEPGPIGLAPLTRKRESRKLPLDRSARA